MIGGYNPWFIEELNRRAENARRVRSDELGLGTCEDIGQYKEECGVLKGIRLMLDLIEEIKQEMDSQ